MSWAARVDERLRAALERSYTRREDHDPSVVLVSRVGLRILDAFNAVTGFRAKALARSPIAAGNPAPQPVDRGRFEGALLGLRDSRARWRAPRSAAPELRSTSTRSSARSSEPSSS